jgi:hypothetical protein
MTEQLEISLTLAGWVVFILIMWYEGDVTDILSRSKLLHRLFNRDEYDHHKQNIDVMATYPEFLNHTYPGFFTKLISCSLCLTFWLTLISQGGLYFLTGMSMNVIFMLPISYIVTLASYLSIKKLLE